MDLEFQNQLCYASTPEHQNTFYGKYIYIYTDKGQLSLTEDGIEYIGKKSTYAIRYSAIKSIEMSHYSRIAKPLKLNFIKLRYVIDSVEHAVFLTPTKSPFMPIHKTNELVKHWLSQLLDVKHTVQNIS